MSQKITVKKEDLNKKQEELHKQNKIIVSFHEDDKGITIEFVDSIEDVPTPPETVEEKPSEIEELRSQVLSLEQTILFLLSGGE